jgi:polysaccharide biosynthesis/export protein
VRKLRGFRTLALLALILNGCATNSPSQSSTPRPEPTAAAATSLKESRLDQLWQSREGPGAASDFLIGTGDVIAVSVPSLSDSQTSTPGGATIGGAESGEQLGDWTVRVNAMGDVILPVLGRIHVAGLTEEQLREELLQRLGKFMYQPQVEVLVRSYNSHQVAISGEVHSPGMYTINKPNETIRDLIMRAGGTTDNAAQTIILTPRPDNAERNANEPSSGAHSQAAAVGDEVVQSVASTGLSSSESAYAIDLSKGHSGDRYLNLPVRAGDTIYIPRAGSVTIIGWVYSPKTIDVTPGLTVLNAISQAGGTLFAADTSNINILRPGPGHETQTITINLNDIKAARAPDVPVHANDVIDVSYSPARIPGYALYYAAQGLVSFLPAALLVTAIP